MADVWWRAEVVGDQGKRCAPRKPSAANAHVGRGRLLDFAECSATGDCRCRDRKLVQGGAGDLAKLVEKVSVSVVVQRKGVSPAVRFTGSFLYGALGVDDGRSSRN
jgi:hypothetical protein